MQASLELFLRALKYRHYTAYHIIIITFQSTAYTKFT